MQNYFDCWTMRFYNCGYIFLICTLEDTDLQKRRLPSPPCKIIKIYSKWSHLKSSQELMEVVTRKLNDTKVLENIQSTLPNTLGDGNSQKRRLPSPPCKIIQTTNSADVERLISGASLLDLVAQMAERRIWRSGGRSLEICPGRLLRTTPRMGGFMYLMYKSCIYSGVD